MKKVLCIVLALTVCLLCASCTKNEFNAKDSIKKTIDGLSYSVPAGATVEQDEESITIYSVPTADGRYYLLAAGAAAREVDEEDGADIIDLTRGIYADSEEERISISEQEQFCGKKTDKSLLVKINAEGTDYNSSILLYVLIGDKIYCAYYDAPQDIFDEQVFEDFCGNMKIN